MPENENNVTLDEVKKEIQATPELIISHTEPCIHVAKKLAKARAKLTEMCLKKSGKNKNIDVDYFELKDFLPQTNLICYEIGLLPMVDIRLNKKEASIRIIDTDSGETLTFTIPIESVSLRNGQAMQNLGALNTYARRYLYMIAFEISDKDIIDSEMDYSDEKKALLAEMNRLNANMPNVYLYFKTTEQDITEEQLKQAYEKKTQKKWETAMAERKQSFDEVISSSQKK